MNRNAAQLRAAADATGWFNGPDHNYVGDGFSVPWQTGFVAGPGFGGAMWLYKAYLDRMYLEYSRLHDWLYTPYGPGLIEASQDEADKALREELATQSTVDATIVYTACSTFGAPYFGVSSVGYVQPPPPRAGDNMPPRAAERSGPVADYKVVVVFQQTTTGEANAPTLGYATVPRTAGWTESYWDTGTTLEGVITRLKGPRTNGLQPILPSRASVLNSQARILGARIYEGGGGRGQFVPMSYPGGSRGGDQPSVALLIAATSLDTISVRRWTLRGIPDDQVINGEFSPSSGYREDLRTYFDSLAGTNFRGRSTVPSQGIFNVTTGGLVTATSALAYAVGAIVTVQTTLDEQGNRRSGQYQVGAVGPLNNQITLVGWPWGTTTGGKISQPASAYFQILTGGIKAVRITTRKVGRPFAAYRGKNSRASRKH